MTYHVHWSGQIKDWVDIIGEDKDTLPPNPPPTPGPDQHSHWLDNLVNVNIDFPPDDNAVLSYDEATGYWVWEATTDGLLGEAWPTGLIDGGELNIAPGPNDVEVIAGQGVIVDSYTDPDSYPTKVFVSWNTINEPITAAPAVAGSLVWILIQTDGVTPGPTTNTFLGTLLQQATPPTEVQKRDLIPLGVLIHNGDVWGEISSPSVINNSAHTVIDYVKSVFGPSYIIDGGAVSEAAAFTLNQAAGTVWEENRNWHVDKKNPHREQFAARTPMQFKYVNRDFTDVGLLTSTVDPSQWDNAGTVEPVGGGSAQSTIQRVYIDPRDNIWILWGQTVYASWAEAVTNLQSDVVEVPFILGESVFLGYIVSERSKLDWDPDESVFFESGAIGGGAGGGTFIPVTFTGAGTTGYVPDPLTESTRLLVDDGSWQNRTHGRNPYVGGNTYYPQDMLYQDGYLMLANKETTDYPAPTPAGDPTFSLPDAPAFQEFQNTSVVASGHLYTFTESGYYRGLRVWVPEVGAEITYRVNIIRNPNGASPGYSTIDNPVLLAGQWNTLDVDQNLILSGEELLVYIEALNSGSDVSPGGTPTDWFRATSSNTALPLAGEWNTNIQETLLRINEDDADANPPIDFNGVVPGSTFTFVDTNDSTVSVEYTAISAETYDAVNGVYSWIVSITSTGASGAPAVGARTVGTIIVPVASPTKFVGIPSPYWNAGNEPAWATVASNLQYDGVDQPVVGDEAYGVDISFQILVASPDWDIYGLPGGGGGGGSGGGGDSFWESNGGTPSDISNINDGNVGIKTTDPLSALTVEGVGQFGTAALNTHIFAYSFGAASFIGAFDNTGPFGTATYTPLNIAGQSLVLQAVSSAWTARTASAWPMVFETDSVERMRITQTGSVGIGTTTPTTDFGLTVAGQVQVCIPTASLVRGGADQLEVWPATGTGTSNIAVTGVDSHGILKLQRGVTSYPILSGTQLGRLQFRAPDDSNGTMQQLASIAAYSEEDLLPGNRGTNLRFYTSPLGGGGVTERMRIHADGFVSINRTDAATNFEVNGAAFIGGDAGGLSMYHFLGSSWILSADRTAGTVVTNTLNISGVDTGIRSLGGTIGVAFYPENTLAGRFDPTGIFRGSWSRFGTSEPDAMMMTLTQAQYDSLGPPNENTLYFIVG